MITVYSWTVAAGEAPWYSSMQMRAAVVSDHTEINANFPVEADPDGARIQALIVEAYNRELAPDPPIGLDGFAFVDPPDGYEWPT